MLLAVAAECGFDLSRLAEPAIVAIEASDQNREMGSLGRDECHASSASMKCAAGKGTSRLRISRAYQPTPNNPAMPIRTAHQVVSVGSDNARFRNGSQLP